MIQHTDAVSHLSLACYAQRGFLKRNPPKDVLKLDQLFRGEGQRILESEPLPARALGLNRLRRFIAFLQVR